MADRVVLIYYTLYRRVWGNKITPPRRDVEGCDDDGNSAVPRSGAFGEVNSQTPRHSDTQTSRHPDTYTRKPDLNRRQDWSTQKLIFETRRRI